MPDPASAPPSLVRDLVAWVAERPREYAEFMEVWRTSCPRLTVWEDALETGLVRRAGARIEVTEAGRALLAGG